ncbi:MAG: N-acetyl-gamma-glutamyl-phosphate reductase [Gemmatimonadaceae bacterium]|nr:N-acetyl-gamma-glutamyl-phosphate reductase [Gemmatimonadaceae bacterium]MDQ3244206.1 N-acetyl-gamma-glutamyl-phosphate reductase [Gemmatimonadota bacterium]
MHKIPVGVLGASGYAGRELCLLIERHPMLHLEFAAAHAQRGETVRFSGREVTFISADDARLEGAQLIFSALPHGASLEWVNRARQAGTSVVDLSADLRPGNGANGVPYGLTELARQEVVGAELVSNPGCYPTAILLGLAPLMRRRMIESGSTISAAAASGVTGAGFTARTDLMFAEVSEDFRAYGVGNEHRHLAEMRAVIERHETTADLVFTPHLLPVARGIFATIVVRLNIDVENPIAVWQEAYAGERFIEISSVTPSLRDVVHRNVARISVSRAANVSHPTLIITVAIDNLTKGAAGQAVQNANLMLGLKEEIGLPA